MLFIEEIHMNNTVIIICSKIQNLKQSLEVCCDRSTFFPLKSADVRGAGTRDEPLRTSAWEAMTSMVQDYLIRQGHGSREA